MKLFKELGIEKVMKNKCLWNQVKYIKLIYLKCQLVIILRKIIELE
jgi:hypothetical protein